MHVWTIGHSTRTTGELLAALQAYGIETLADVRRFPGSRRHPQFGAQALAEALQRQDIAYAWIGKLGGRRRTPAGAPVASAWRNPSFAAYAAYTEGEEFAQGLDELLHLAAAARTAIMCSELLWWRCHRAIISDVLVSLGVGVTHILDAGKATEHTATGPARIVDGRLTYAPADEPA